MIPHVAIVPSLTGTQQATDEPQRSALPQNTAINTKSAIGETHGEQLATSQAPKGMFDAMLKAAGQANAALQPNTAPNAASLIDHVVNQHQSFVDGFFANLAGVVGDLFPGDTLIDGIMQSVSLPEGANIAGVVATSHVVWQETFVASVSVVPPHVQFLFNQQQPQEVAYAASAVSSLELTFLDDRGNVAGETQLVSHLNHGAANLTGLFNTAEVLPEAVQTNGNEINLIPKEQDDPTISHLIGLLETIGVPLQDRQDRPALTNITTQTLPADATTIAGNQQQETLAGGAAGDNVTAQRNTINISSAAHINAVNTLQQQLQMQSTSGSDEATSSLALLQQAGLLENSDVASLLQMMASAQPLSSAPPQRSLVHLDQPVVQSNIAVVSKASVKPVVQVASQQVASSGELLVPSDASYSNVEPVTQESAPQQKLQTQLADNEALVETVAPLPLAGQSVTAREKQVPSGASFDAPVNPSQSNTKSNSNASTASTAAIPIVKAEEIGAFTTPATNPPVNNNPASAQGDVDLQPAVQGSRQQGAASPTANAPAALSESVVAPSANATSAATSIAPSQAQLSAPLSATMSKMPASAQSGTPTQQVAVQIQQATPLQPGRMMIQLHPAELGMVEVQILLDNDNNALIKVMAESREAYDILRADRVSLERSLQEAGIKIDSQNLQFDHQRDQQFSDNQRSDATHDGDSDGQQQNASQGEGSDSAFGDESMMLDQQLLDMMDEEDYVQLDNVLNIRV